MAWVAIWIKESVCSGHILGVALSPCFPGIIYNIYIYILSARPPSPDSITHPRTSSATLHMKTIILMCVHI